MENIVNAIENNSTENTSIENNLKYAIIKYGNDNIKCRINDDEYNECRICYEESTDENPYLFPCKCAGTMRFIHESCLNHWRNDNIDNMNFHKCNECNTFYQKSFSRPLEKNFLFPYKHKIFFRFYLPSVFLFVIIALINDYNGQIDDILGYDKTGNITKLIQHSEYDFCVYYMGFSMNCVLDLFFSYYVFMIFYAINNRLKFIDNIKYRLLSKIFFSNGYFLSMPMFISTQSYNTFFIIMMLYIILIPFYANTIYNDNKRVIKKINLENEVVIYNYDPEYDNQININFENFINNILDHQYQHSENRLMHNLNNNMIDNVNNVQQNNIRNREYRRVFVYELND